MKIRYVASIKIILSSSNNIIFITQMPVNIHRALASTTAAMVTANILENATNAESKNFSSSIITLASVNAQGAATAIEIAELEKQQQEQELHHQPQSQLHNSAVNLHVQEDPKNRHQEHQQYSLTNPQQHHKDKNGTSMIQISFVATSMIQISFVTSSVHMIQSSKAINAKGDINSTIYIFSRRFSISFLDRQRFNIFLTDHYLILDCHLNCLRKYLLDMLLLILGYLGRTHECY